MRTSGRSGWLAACAVALGGCGTSEEAPARAPATEAKAPAATATEAKAPAPEAKCPVTGAHAGPTRNADWWPNQLDLGVLHQPSAASDPLGPSFDYASEFAKLDLAALRKDLVALLTTSQDWWPADYGHYGPLFIRLAWHSAGTYRVTDGRGGAAAGTIRFAPLSSFPDNANLDKARRLLWPIKQKYGRAISWADLMIFTGNVALESMGFETLGFAGGRVDAWEPEVVDWGTERTWLGDERHAADGTLARPLGATQMGLIYVNPEGPGGKPDPLAAAKHIRLTFGRMAMNDEETVALIAGGHTLGKAHGAAPAAGHVGPEPEAAGLEEQGLGWRSSYGKGNAGDTITSGLEGAWTSTPVEWSHGYFENLYGFEWELAKGPGGAWQWRPKGGGATVPDAHDPKKAHAPMMFTTDLALRLDPIYGPISKKFHEQPAAFEAAFARAWYKLTHRDLGPYARCLGPLVPPAQPWQDPVPAAEGPPLGVEEVAALEAKVLASGLTTAQLVRTAWASAATFRGTDLRGGANGARLRLAPQKDWEVNRPAELATVLATLEGIRREHGRVSLADLIVLAGGAAIERAAKEAGHEVTVPFRPGRTDATQEATDVASFAVLEPTSDGFRNYHGPRAEGPAHEQLVEQARRLTLTAPELTVLLGGLRVLGANHDGSAHGAFTRRPGALTNDFFVHLLDPTTEWRRAAQGHVYEGRDRRTGELRWTATSVDLLFGSNSQLRAIAEVHAADDAKRSFVDAFVAAWVKVMELDRFDLRR